MLIGHTPIAITGAVPVGDLHTFSKCHSFDFQSQKIGSSFHNKSSKFNILYTCINQNKVFQI